MPILPLSYQKPKLVQPLITTPMKTCGSLLERKLFTYSNPVNACVRAIKSKSHFCFGGNCGNDVRPVTWAWCGSAQITYDTGIASTAKWYWERNGFLFCATAFVISPLYLLSHGNTKAFRMSVIIWVCSESSFCNFNRISTFRTFRGSGSYCSITSAWKWYWPFNFRCTGTVKYSPLFTFLLLSNKNQHIRCL